MAGFPDIGAFQTGAPDIGAFQTAGAAPSGQTIDPDSILTAESWGSLFLAFDQVVSPGSIPTGEDWGSPIIAGGDQEIEPASIPSTESWGTVNIAGPVNPASILSGESWGTPLLNVEQAVSPGTILSTESWGTPVISHVTALRPASIDSGESWGEPTLQQNLAPIFPASIESAESWGAPDVGGGTETLQIFVGNYDRSRWQFRPNGVKLSQKSMGRWTGTAIFQNCPAHNEFGYTDMSALDTDQEFVPAFGMTVLIKEFGRTLFRGCIRQVIARRHPTTNLVVYECSLGDKSVLCERRRVTRYYPAASEPDAVQWDMADVIRDIVESFLNGEGIDIDPELPASLGLLSAPIQQFVTVSQAFDQLRDMMGYAGWFIDLTQSLRFAEVTGVEDAPFELLESGLQWRDLEVRVTDEDYRNKQYVMSNRKLLPTDGGAGSNTETYALLRWGDRPNAGTDGSLYNPEAGYQQRAFEGGFPPYYYVTEFGIDRIISAKLNGVEVDVFLSSEISFDDYNILRDGVDRAWVYDGGGSSLVYFPSLTADPFSPLNAKFDVIEIVYMPTVAAQQASATENDVFSVEQPIEPLPGEKFGTCGSGRFEHVEQVNDVFTREAGLALAQGLLERSGGIQKIVSFETDYPGFQVGQRMACDVPRNMLNDEDIYITELDGTSVEGTDLGHESSFRWRVTGSNRPDVGPWLKTWERLWRRTQHPTPTPRLAPTTIVLGSGAYIRSGEELNPGKINETGRLVDVVAVFLDPPVDQDLVIDVRLDDVSIFNSAKLVIPANETDDVRPSGYSQTPLYGFKEQVVTVHISYRVTGPNPVAAKNGTVILRWDV